MMRAFLLYILLLSALSGCNTTQVYSDYNKSTDFKKYRTYAWLPDADTSHGRPVFDNDIFRKNLHDAVNVEMKKMGFSLDTLQPDFLVLIHTNFEHKKATVRTPLYSSYPYYYPGFYPGPWYPYYYPRFYDYPYIAGYELRNVEFTEGSIVIDFIDRESKALVWRGWSVADADDPQAFQRYLPRTIEEILQKYPGRKSRAGEGY